MASQAHTCAPLKQMGTLNSRRPSIQRSIVAALAFSVVALSGCYVVPIDPRAGQPPASYPAPVVAPAPGPLNFPVRLYPSNDLATRYGMITASVSNDLNGHGTFNAAINGESFSGEATRKSRSSREGLANGAGNRGSFLACAYTLNTPAQGTGQCRLSDGALFTMHLGN
jgi:hypothetical protein